MIRTLLDRIAILTYQDFNIISRLELLEGNKTCGCWGGGAEGSKESSSFLVWLWGYESTRTVAKLHGGRKWANTSLDHLGARVCRQVSVRARLIWRARTCFEKSRSYCTIIAKNRREIQILVEEERREEERTCALSCEETLLGYFFQSVKSRPCRCWNRRTRWLLQNKVSYCA